MPLNHVSTMLQDVLYDLRYAVRALARHRAFAAVAVTALALGIGANTTVFSLVNAALLRPLPYGDAGRIVVVYEDEPARGVGRSAVSFPDYLDVKEGVRSLEAVSAFIGAPAGLSGACGGCEPERVTRGIVTLDFFAALSARPALGRPFVAEDAEPTPHAVVLSRGFWVRRLGGARDAVGRTITLNQRPYTIVGVMPAGVTYPEVDVWTPLVLRLTDAGAAVRANRSLRVIARLRPGATLERARADMDVLTRRLQRDYPESNTGWRMRLQPLRDDLVGTLRPQLLMLFGAVALVLLIACANVANLLLARGAVRHREVAIRAALGASRGRIVRQLLTESLVLAATGGALGVLIALWGVRAVHAAAPGGMPAWIAATVDLRVVAFTVGVSLLTGALFGAVPAFRASRADLHGAMGRGGRGASSGAATGRLRTALAVAEVALSLVLLAGAGLLMRSFLRLQQADPGFDPRGVLTLRLTLPQARYPDAPRQAAFYAELLRRVRALPGVRAAGGVMTPPTYANQYWTTIGVEGQPPDRPGEERHVHNQMVTPGYFAALRIPLRRGRDFDGRDDSAAPRVALVNEKMARTFWPGENPVGKRILVDAPGPDGPWTTVVGVVADVRQFGVKNEPGPELFRPVAQNPPSELTIAVRTAGAPAAAAAAVRREVASLDRDLAVYDVATLEEVLARDIWQPRLYGLLLGIFAAGAVLLAAVGLYGVIAFMVAQRTREVGVRMALGATRRDILRLVAWHGVRVAALGVALGLVGSLAATRALGTLLYGVTPSDPLTLAAVSLLLAGVTLVATLLPARRAARVEPVVALRSE